MMFGSMKDSTSKKWPCHMDLICCKKFFTIMKARDPMRWVGLMNTLKAQAEEIVLTELI